jgi:hypothetical protein
MGQVGEACFFSSASVSFDPQKKQKQILHRGRCQLVPWMRVSQASQSLVKQASDMTSWLSFGLHKKFSEDGLSD